MLPNGDNFILGLYMRMQTSREENKIFGYKPLFGGKCFRKLHSFIGSPFRRVVNFKGRVLVFAVLGTKLFSY